MSTFCAVVIDFMIIIISTECLVIEWEPVLTPVLDIEEIALGF